MSLLRHPALGMATAGALLFVASQLVSTGAERPHVVVADHRYRITLEAFRGERGREPTAEERRLLLDQLIDEELLYRYAVELGMREAPAAERRLARIAEFVRTDPHAPMPSDAALAAKAVELGLDRGDLVVRRILIDGARRLIRGVVLMQTPRPEYVAEYLEAHPEEFVRPARVRITQVLVNAFAHGAASEERARGILERIRAEHLSEPDAVALGDAVFEPAVLPALTRSALTARFGGDFAEQVMALPAERWEGPIPSRHGYHVVFVHERLPEQLPPEAELEPKVAERLLQKIADEYLALRLAELRHAFVIDAPADPS